MPKPWQRLAGPPAPLPTQQEFLDKHLIPVTVESLESNNRKCAHCWKLYGESDEGLDNAENPVKLPCGHVLGEKCMRELFEVQAKANDAFGSPSSELGVADSTDDDDDFDFESLNSGTPLAYTSSAETIAAGKLSTYVTGEPSLAALKKMYKDGLRKAFDEYGQVLGSADDYTRQSEQLHAASKSLGAVLDCIFVELANLASTSADKGLVLEFNQLHNEISMKKEEIETMCIYTSQNAISKNLELAKAKIKSLDTIASHKAAQAATNGTKSEEHASKWKHKIANSLAETTKYKPTGANGHPYAYKAESSPLKPAQEVYDECLGAPLKTVQNIFAAQSKKLEGTSLAQLTMDNPSEVSTIKIVLDGIYQAARANMKHLDFSVYGQEDREKWKDLVVRLLHTRSKIVESIRDADFNTPGLSKLYASSAFVPINVSKDLKDASSSAKQYPPIAKPSKTPMYETNGLDLASKVSKFMGKVHTLVPNTKSKSWGNPEANISSPTTGPLFNPSMKDAAFQKGFFPPKPAFLSDSLNVLTSQPPPQSAGILSSEASAVDTKAKVDITTEPLPQPKTSHMPTYLSLSGTTAMSPASENMSPFLSSFSRTSKGPDACPICRKQLFQKELPRFHRRSTYPNIFEPSLSTPSNYLLSVASSSKHAPGDVGTTASLTGVSKNSKNNALSENKCLSDYSKHFGPGKFFPAWTASECPGGKGAPLSQYNANLLASEAYTSAQDLFSLGATLLGTAVSHPKPPYETSKSPKPLGSPFLTQQKGVKSHASEIFSSLHGQLTSVALEADGSANPLAKATAQQETKELFTEENKEGSFSSFTPALDTSLPVKPAHHGGLCAYCIEGDCYIHGSDMNVVSAYSDDEDVPSVEGPEFNGYDDEDNEAHTEMMDYKYEWESDD